MKRFLLALLLAAAPGLSFAAPARLERDLGHGLAYCRVHSLPADLPAASGKPGAVVLDLRYARGDDSAAPALGAWLKVHCTATTPVFVLVNAETAPALLAYLAAIAPPAGLVTLGATSPRFEPDIALKISPAAERVAYDALEHGTPLDSLLTDSSVKPRHDEASIAQERTGAPGDATTGDPDASDADETTAATPAAPPPVIDYALQRAVHLHRALLALRKL
jgi:hypothetical protein